ncbi:MAG: DUF4177 domain-containing protein [Sulfitobacter sp.]
MIRYEYKVVAAPTKGIKGKGVRGAEAKFSFALQELMNGMAGYGWEYQRAETLPSIERSGLAGTTTEWRNVLVFRRPRTGDAAEFQPELLPAPPQQVHSDAQMTADEDVEEDSFSHLSPDNGVEDLQNNTAIGPSLSILARARSLSPPSETDALEGEDDDQSSPKS